MHFLKHYYTINILFLGEPGYILIFILSNLFSDSHILRFPKVDAPALKTVTIRGILKYIEKISNGSVFPNFK